MSTFNVVNLELIASSAISSITNVTCSLDLLTYATTLSQLKTGAVFTASNLTSLPTASTSTGSLYFVGSERTVYWATTATGWAPLVTGTANELWGWGNNRYSRTGDGTASSIDRCSPVREFCSATDWCDISTGGHSAAIKITGQLWSWGFDNNGRLGIGVAGIRCSPVREFCSATDWCQVSVGYFHTVAAKTSGQIWGWGNNTFGQLATGSTSGSYSPVREFCSATDWCQVSAGLRHTVALKTNGQIWAWGQNNCGQMADGTIINKCSPVREFCSASNWCRIFSGGNHVLAINTAGQLWGWGRNDNGRLGDGTTLSRCSPVREFCSATDWSNIAVGNYHSLAIKTSGQLWAWGLNAGRLGNGTTTESCSPVREFCSATDWCHIKAAFAFSVGIKTSGQLWSWGGGALGDGTTLSRCSPVREFCSATDWWKAGASSYSCTSTAIKLKTFN
jgi:alpha-tubulin suppressor-like RCC1 family protein